MLLALGRTVRSAGQVVYEEGPLDMADSGQGWALFYFCPLRTVPVVDASGPLMLVFQQQTDQPGVLRRGRGLRQTLKPL